MSFRIQGAALDLAIYQVGIGRGRKTPVLFGGPAVRVVDSKRRFRPILLKNSDFGRKSKIFGRTARLIYSGEGFGKRKGTSPVASLWNRSRQSSLSIPKGVLLAEIFEIQLSEFFNRISPMQPSFEDAASGTKGGLRTFAAGCAKDC